VTKSFIAPSGSGLTHKQRSLLIVVIILLCYIALGALINTILINLSFVDALYFSVVTIETIGFGDISPRTTSARIFSCFYATVGVLNVALMVGLMRDTVLETFEIHYRIRMRKLRRWRQVVSRRRRIEERWRVAIEWRLREANKRTWVKDACHTDTGVVNFLGKTLDRIRWPWIKGVNDRNQYVYGHGFGNHPHGMRLNLEALTPAQLEAAALEAGVPLETLLPPGFKAEKKTVDSTHGELSREEARRSIPLTHARLGRMVSMLSQFALAVHRSGVTPSSQPTPSLASSDINGEDDEKITQNETYLGTPQTPTIVPLFRRGLAEEYDTFRKKAKSEEKRAFYSRLFVAWVLFIVFWTIGSAIFMVTEGWSYGVAMYFCGFPIVWVFFLQH
jgi:hypothetical protein